jgi:hypothetical protein
MTDEWRQPKGSFNTHFVISTPFTRRGNRKVMSREEEIIIPDIHLTFRILHRFQINRFSHKCLHINFPSQIILNLESESLVTAVLTVINVIMVFPNRTEVMHAIMKCSGDFFSKKYFRENFDTCQQTAK